MRFISYALTILIAFTAFSCKKFDQLVSFNLDTKDKVFWETAYDSVLTDTIVGNEFASFISDEYSFKDYSKFETNKTTPQNVEQVEAFNLTVGIDSGASSFSFAGSMLIYLSSPKNLFKEMKLVEINDPSKLLNSSFSFEMKVTNEEWVSIIQKEKYQFRTEFELVSPMPDSIYLDYVMNFRIKALPND